MNVLPKVTLHRFSLKISGMKVASPANDSQLPLQAPTLNLAMTPKLGV